MAPELVADEVGPGYDISGADAVGGDEGLRRAKGGCQVSNI